MAISETKVPVGIIGATGMVGQRLITLLKNHPWFEIKLLAASSRSEGKTYAQAVQNRWSMEDACPQEIQNLIVHSADKVSQIADQVSFVFCAIEADKGYIRNLEFEYAKKGLGVVSNNSAHRWSEDVPMLMPEINLEHLDILPIQQQKHNFGKGFVIVKPNCSIQSYVPQITAWQKFDPSKILVSTYQAISGAGKTFETWPEILDNIIPLIKGEEEKSEKEPAKIWGSISDGKIVPADKLKISANCVRVPVSDGHLATINIKFDQKITKIELIEALQNFPNKLQGLDLPNKPSQFITYFEEEDRPQTKLDRDLYAGMGISTGRLREDTIFDWKCIGLSHNTLRGAAGGSLLNAEVLYKLGYIR